MPGGDSGITRKSHDASETLAQGLVELQLELAADARERLMKYVALLEKWNTVYNLTAITGTRRIVTHHLLDSLAVLPHLERGSLVDVGSGAGLPGIPLAIARPQDAMTLLDANQKKAAFLRQAVIELALANASVVCDRVERWQPPARFQVVISRAFSDLGKFLALAGRLCAERGTVVAMRGAYSASAHTLHPGFNLKRVFPLTVPGLDAARHLIMLEPARAAT